MVNRLFLTAINQYLFQRDGALRKEVLMIFAFALHMLGKVIAWSSPTATFVEQPRATRTPSKVMLPFTASVAHQ
jgi:hypothetical protein